MKIRTSAIAMLIALAFPLAATAGPIQTIYFGSQADDGDASFGPSGASGHDRLDPVSTCDNFGCDEVQLSLNWDAGPLLDFVPFPDTPDGWGKYTYGAGTLTVDGDWNSVGFEPGVLIAHITSVVIDVGGTCSFGVCASTTARLGDGLFSASLAHALGVSMPTIGGQYVILTDGATVGGGYGDHLGDNYGNLHVQVPEPATAVITALGILGAAIRRRRSTII